MRFFPGTFGNYILTLFVPLRPLQIKEHLFLLSCIIFSPASVHILKYFKFFKIKQCFKVPAKNVKWVHNYIKEALKDLKDLKDLKGIYWKREVRKLILLPAPPTGFTSLHQKQPAVPMKNKWEFNTTLSIPKTTLCSGIVSSHSHPTSQKQRF